MKCGFRVSILVSMLVINIGVLLFSRDLGEVLTSTAQAFVI